MKIISSETFELTFNIFLLYFIIYIRVYNSRQLLPAQQNEERNYISSQIIP